MKNYTVCLCMIVKNESHVIKRCLDSVIPFIDYFVICDTGSTDNTCKIIADTMKGIPGEIHHHQWNNFAENRTKCLQLAKGKADFIFTLDADEELIIDSIPEKLANIDCYNVICKYNTLTYCRPLLFTNKLDWFYVGVLHEYLDSKSPFAMSPLEGIHVKVYPEGNRSKDPLKYQKDAITLQNALLTEQNNPRYVFYLANSYRDCEQWDLAIHYYQQRCLMSGFEQETWYSYYQLAKCKHRRGDSIDSVINAYLLCWNKRPIRAEPLYFLVLLYKQRNLPEIAKIYAAIGMKIPKPNDLFVEHEIYEFQLKELYAELTKQTVAA